MFWFLAAAAFFAGCALLEDDDRTGRWFALSLLAFFVGQLWVSR